MAADATHTHAIAVDSEGTKRLIRFPFEPGSLESIALIDIAAVTGLAVGGGFAYIQGTTLSDDRIVSVPLATGDAQTVVTSSSEFYE